MEAGLQESVQQNGMETSKQTFRLVTVAAAAIPIVVSSSKASPFLGSASLRVLSSLFAV